MIASVRSHSLKLVVAFNRSVLFIYLTGKRVFSKIVLNSKTMKGKKKITLVCAALITLLGVVLIGTYLSSPSQPVSLFGLAAGSLLLYPAVNGWAELLEPSRRDDEGQKR